MQYWWPKWACIQSVHKEARKPICVRHPLWFRTAFYLRGENRGQAVHLVHHGQVLEGSGSEEKSVSLFNGCCWAEGDLVIVLTQVNDLVQVTATQRFRKVTSVSACISVSSALPTVSFLIYLKWQVTTDGRMHRSTKFSQLLNSGGELNSLLCRNCYKPDILSLHQFVGKQLDSMLMMAHLQCQTLQWVLMKSSCFTAYYNHQLTREYASNGNCDSACRQNTSPFTPIMNTHSKSPCT